MEWLISSIVALVLAYIVAGCTTATYFFDEMQTSSKFEKYKGEEIVALAWLAGIAWPVFCGIIFVRFICVQLKVVFAGLLMLFKRLSSGS